MNKTCDNCGYEWDWDREEEDIVFYEPNECPKCDMPFNQQKIGDF